MRSAVAAKGVVAVKTGRNTLIRSVLTLVTAVPKL